MVKLLFVALSLVRSTLKPSAFQRCLHCLLDSQPTLLLHLEIPKSNATLVADSSLIHRGSTQPFGKEANSSQERGFEVCVSLQSCPHTIPPFRGNYYALAYQRSV